MSYSVTLESRAAADVQAIPLPLRRQVAERLSALGEAPTRLSKPRRTPGAVGQQYEFVFSHEGMNCWVESAFQYGSDEQTLYIQYVRWEMA
jgi:hypothetical protein